MKIYEFGDSDRPAMLLLPGTSCHWKLNFGKVIPLLQEKFHVLAVSYDGFDETENTIFPDMITETKRIEDYIKENYGGNIFAAYGSSLGGSFVSLLVGRQNIHINHAIIGSSDMDQADGIVANIETAIVEKIMGKLVREGKLPKFAKLLVDKCDDKKREYLYAIIGAFSGEGNGQPYVQLESIRNQFYSDLVTEVGENISADGTEIHVFYATKMGAKYEKIYRKHFKNPDIIRQNYEHEELLFMYPKMWYQEILKCTLTN